MWRLLAGGLLGGIAGLVLGSLPLLWQSHSPTPNYLVAELACMVCGSTGAIVGTIAGATRYVVQTRRRVRGL